MTSKPLGGRGKKAPYETVTMRVPVPLVSQLEEIVDNYRNEVIAGIPATQKLMDRDDVIQEAKKILKGTRSPKQSVLKLLQVLYGDDVTEDSLK